MRLFAGPHVLRLLSESAGADRPPSSNGASPKMINMLSLNLGTTPRRPYRLNASSALGFPTRSQRRPVGPRASAPRNDGRHARVSRLRRPAADSSASMTRPQCGALSETEATSSAHSMTVRPPHPSIPVLSAHPKTSGPPRQARCSPVALSATLSRALIQSRWCRRTCCGGDRSTPLDLHESSGRKVDFAAARAASERPEAHGRDVALQGEVTRSRSLLAHRAGAEPVRLRSSPSGAGRFGLGKHVQEFVRGERTP